MSKVIDIPEVPELDLDQVGQFLLRAEVRLLSALAFRKDNVDQSKIDEIQAAIEAFIKDTRRFAGLIFVFTHDVEIDRHADASTHLIERLLTLSELRLSDAGQSLVSQSMGEIISKFNELQTLRPAILDRLRVKVFTEQFGISPEEEPVRQRAYQLRGDLDSEPSGIHPDILHPMMVFKQAMAEHPNKLEEIMLEEGQPEEVIRNLSIFGTTAEELVRRVADGRDIRSLVRPWLSLERQIRAALVPDSKFAALVERELDRVKAATNEALAAINSVKEAAKRRKIFGTDDVAIDDFLTAVKEFEGSASPANIGPDPDAASAAE